MIFSRPISFDEAMQSRKVKALMPTNLSHAQLQRLPAQIRERSLFAARVNNAKLLQELDEVVSDIINPKVEQRTDGATVQVGYSDVTARDKIREVLDRIRYQPPKGKEGTIEDLSSNHRIDLMVRVQAQLSQGYGEWEQSQDPVSLRMWPCVELRRVYPRVEPRGTREGYPDEYWQRRWVELGGQLYDGRMICRKDDSIREAISDFGLPYGPPGFNSGYDWVQVPRRTAEELGVISKGERAYRQTRNFNQDMEASVDSLSPELRDELLSKLDEYTDEEFYVSSGGEGRVMDYGSNEVMPEREIHGLIFVLENAKGTTRSGIDPDGRPWAVTMPADYGELHGFRGADGDYVDAYVGWCESAEVHVIDQRNVFAPGNEFDEHKCFINFPSVKAAQDTYLAGYTDGRGADRIAGVTTMNLDEFKQWLADKAKTKRAVLAANAETTRKATLKRSKHGKVFLVRRHRMKFKGGKKLMDFISRNAEGFNVDPNNENEPQTGYAVAHSKATEFYVPKDKLTPEVIDAYLEHHRAAFENHPGEVYLGGWYNHDAGAFCLDVSVVTPDIKHAEWLAKKGQQDAIFNLDEKRQIKTGEIRFDAHYEKGGKLELIQAKSYPELSIDEAAEQRWRQRFDWLNKQMANETIIDMLNSRDADVRQHIRVTQHGVSVVQQHKRELKHGEATRADWRKGWGEYAARRKASFAAKSPSMQAKLIALRRAKEKRRRENRKRKMQGMPPIPPIDEHQFLHGQPQQGGQIAITHEMPGETAETSEMLHAIRTGKHKQTHLGGGCNGSFVREITYEGPDGVTKTRKVVWKPIEGEHKNLRGNMDDSIMPYAYREYVAYRAADMLGIESPAVALTEINGKVGTAMAFVPNAKTHQEVPRYTIEHRKRIGELAAFDYIVGNSDRHSGNFMVQNPDDPKSSAKLWPIDNGLSFPDRRPSLGVRGNSSKMISTAMRINSGSAFTRAKQVAAQAATPEFRRKFTELARRNKMPEQGIQNTFARIDKLNNLFAASRDYGGADAFGKIPWYE